MVVLSYAFFIMLDGFWVAKVGFFQLTYGIVVTMNLVLS